MKPLMRVAFALLVCLRVAGAIQSIPVDDDRVQVRGSRYVSRTSSEIRFQRHSEDVLGLPRQELGLNPDKARNTTGVVLAFHTDSRVVRARFQVLSANYMGSVFGVFENDELIEEFKFRPTVKEATLEFTSATEGASRFDIVLPSFANVAFLGLDLDDGATLLTPADGPNKVYVALGDSISHGVGQKGASHTTWPFLLSRKLGYELFNLAVGGGKVSVPVGGMLEDWDRVDLVTILVGYNDLHFNHKSPETYRTDYARLLDAIRANHPETRIACITPLFTKKPTAAKTGHTIQSFRDVLGELVDERRAAGDRNLILIKGDAITSERNLRADHPEDPVHLGVEGASMLADEVFRIIQGLK